LAGSEKRIKELKTAFDTPPRYGKGLDWTGYTVHDAANILRRYFNHLPEPIIPLGNYDSFRQPLRNHQAEAVGPIEGQAPSIGGFDPDDAVRNYQHTIKGLPSLNRQLLLYILDLLAVFAAKSDVNKMTTSNLAAIFQPGILSHPQHDMSPQDYRLNQDVLIFLIDNQDHFLIGMEGTAVDEGTVKHIESGPSTPQGRSPTATRTTAGIDRSASTASSAGADSLRKYGGVRRNVSTSSKRSRHSGAVPSPITAGFASPTGSGVHRSNTLPSKRSPALSSPRFPREKLSGPTTPIGDESGSLLSPTTIDAAANMPQTEKLPTAAQTPTAANPATNPATEQARPVQVSEAVLAAPAEEAPPKRAQTMPPNKIELPAPAFLQSTQARPLVDTPALASIPGAFPLASPSIIPPSGSSTPAAATPVQAAHELTPRNVSASGRRSPHLTPNRERSEFLEGPVDSGPSVEPTPAVRTFTQILSKVAVSPSGDSKDGKDGRKPNKLQKKRLATGMNQSAHSSTHSLTGGMAGYDMIHGHAAPASPLFPPQPAYAQGQPQATGSKEGLQTFTDAGSSRNSGTTLKPTMSPSASFRSHSTATEYSEAELNEEPLLEEKRSFWKSHKRGESKAVPTSSQADLHGSVPGGDKSMSSFGSSAGRGGGGGGGGRRSLQYDGQQGSEASMVFGSPPEGERSGEKKSTFDWFHKMRHDHKERTDRRERTKSPQGSMSNMPLPQNLLRPRDSFPARDRSADHSRSTDAPWPTEAPRPTDAPRPNEVPHPNEVSRSMTEPSSDVTPTGSSPIPATAAPAPAAVPEPTVEEAKPRPSSTADAPPIDAPLKGEAPVSQTSDAGPAPQDSVRDQEVETTAAAPMSREQSTPASPVDSISQGEATRSSAPSIAQPYPSAPSPAIAQILASPIAPRSTRSPVRGSTTNSPSRTSPGMSG
jgi:hypothetical protein